MSHLILAVSNSADTYTALENVAQYGHRSRFYSAGLGTGSRFYGGVAL